MMNTKVMLAVASNDTELVAASLAGNREAFGLIVARYQSLVCSLAYSATGNLNASEDLAQETFITAWKQLAGLREPEKLRAWLCAIARNLINNSLRRSGREPSHRAESLEDAPESLAPGPQPAEQAISNEELAILWRSLEQIPELYREPMVLYYREHQSVEAVAIHLELTEDAVKQRLSRGRKLLQEQVLAFVEGALARTSPGKAFTLSVLAAIPAMTISAKAATLGAAAAKGSAAAKAAGAIGLFGALLSPLLGCLGMWLGYRTSIETARSERERIYTRNAYRWLGGTMLVFFVIFGVLMVCGGSLVKVHVRVFVSLIFALALIYAIALAIFSVWSKRAREKFMATLTPEEQATRPTQPVWEYRSRFELLGLPFIHFRSGDRLAAPVKAWIAVGDCAFGVLFAAGGLAVAPVALGGCALGFFSIGGMAVGALASGGCGLGIWSFGGLAIGWEAFGGCAIAWQAACGGYAIAQEFAVGGLVHAHQAGTDLAVNFMRGNRFMQISYVCLPYIYLVNLAWVVPMILQRRLMARRKRNESHQPT